MSYSFKCPEKLITEYERYRNKEISINDCVPEEFNEIFYNSEWFKERPDIIKKCFKEYPCSKFYKHKDSDLLFRITGFHETESGEILAQTNTLFIGMINKTIGGYPLNELIKLDEWSEEDIRKINFKIGGIGDLKYVFLHPMGYLFLLDEEDE
jgi:hypothetical protein